jgi:hypothetical protein
MSVGTLLVIYCTGVLIGIYIGWSACQSYHKKRVYDD